MIIIPDVKFYAIAETNRSTFASLVSRGEGALAFGVGAPLAGGHFVAADAAVVLMAYELHPAFGRKYASTILRGHADKVLWCLGKADTTSEPVFFGVAEYGDVQIKHTSSRAFRDQLRVGPLVFSEFKGFGPAIQQPERVTLINVSNIVRRVRANGKREGIDLSAPFFPPPGDAVADKIIEMMKEDRERALKMFRAEMSLQ